jgi:NADPH2:quinone reductase
VRAVSIDRFGGSDVLELVELPAPTPGPRQLLVDVGVAGVNYRDIYEREGLYGGAPPLVVGAEGAGTVAGVGADVSEFAPGDRVAWAAAPGSYAEQALVDADRAVPVPEAVGEELAAASLLQGMTAQYLCSATYPVEAGETVLVHAAAGGVGLLLTQLVKLRGGRVIGTTSTPEKEKLARAAGADEVIGYEGFAERVRELTGGEGVSAVYDGVGQATFDDSLASLRTRGFLVLYGAASGPVPEFQVQRLMSGGSLYVTRPSLVHHTRTRGELLDRARDVFEWIADGKLNVRVGGRYPLEQARAAHEDLTGRRTSGKLLLLVR